MVHDQLHAVVVQVAVHLLVGLEVELREHLGRHERRDLRAPIVVMEDGVGVHVRAQALGEFQLVFGDVGDEVVHLIGAFVEAHHRGLDLAQVMRALEHAGDHVRGGEFLSAVDRFGLRDLRLPVGFHGLSRLGALHVFLPVLEVLDHAMLHVVQRKRARLPFGPLLPHAPVVLDGRRAVLDLVVRPRLAHDGRHELVLLDESVGISPVDGLEQILADGKHGCAPLVSISLPLQK